MPAEKIFINGKILTVDINHPEVQALAVAGGKFIAIGTNDEILALHGPATEVIDLGGHTVVPGLNDSHMHLMSVGAAKETVNLAPATSHEDLIKRSKEFLAANPGQPWLLGRGWSQERFTCKTLPTRHHLDKITTELPVYLFRVCGHVAVANSMALALAGITRETPQPLGGHIDLDEYGDPTGVLRERAIGLVGRLIPERGLEDYKRMFEKGAQEALSYGLTSVQSDDMADLSAAEVKLQALQELVAEGRFPIRYNIQARLSQPEQIDRLLELKRQYSFPDHTVEFGPLKLMCDGSLGGRTAAMNEPYSDDPSTCGVAILTQAQINEMLAYGHERGLQVSGHAIGDRTMDMLLAGFRHMLTIKPATDARPRIIHAQLTNQRILEECQELGVVCDIQPVFVSTDLHFVERRIGKDRAKLTYAWKTMREMGIATAGGSDSPVENCNPMQSFYAAVTRQDVTGFPEGGWLPEQKLTLREVLELFTMGSAYASFNENIKGSITLGKLADFIVLSEDITETPKEQLKDVTVKASFVGGHCVYKNLQS